jgi:hypothetical protein
MKLPKTEFDNGFECGYNCAVITLLRLTFVERNGVETIAKELWKENSHSINDLKKFGVPVQDIKLLKKYWKELNH